VRAVEWPATTSSPSDCYGTLIDWVSGITDAIADAARRAGHAVAREAILPAYLRTEVKVEATAYHPYRVVLADTASRLITSPRTGTSSTRAGTSAARAGCTRRRATTTTWCRRARSGFLLHGPIVSTRHSHRVLYDRRTRCGTSRRRPIGWRHELPLGCAHTGGTPVPLIRPLPLMVAQASCLCPTDA
jgi:hypothetical protein